MNNIKLVIEREYKSRVLKRSFLLMTLLMPLLFLGITILPAFLMNLSSPSQETIAILDHTGRYDSLFKDTENYHFVKATHSIGEYKKGLDVDSDLSGVLEIRQNLLEDPKAISLFSYKTLPSGIENHINTILSDYLTDEVIDSYHIPDFKERMKQAEVVISVPTYRWGNDGTETFSSSSVTSIFGIVLSMFIYIFLMLYGSMVLQSVMEEKKNRIMEVMLSAVRPFDLMMGKIIGVGLVGLTQLFCWILLLGALMLALPLILPSLTLVPVTPEPSNFASPTLGGEVSQMLQALLNLNYMEIIPLVILYFIGGYLFYASILASLGATVSSDEDATQMMLPVTMVMIISFYISMSCFESPEGMMALFCSFIPFTAPTVMMSRLSYSVPLWQELLSLAILYSSFVLASYFGAKVYRMGSLLYGKKPTIKEIWKWIKY